MSCPDDDKLGVRGASFFHGTECFGPVLGLMRAESLDEAMISPTAPRSVSRAASRRNDSVMAAMGKVPRHRFVPPRQQAFAYENRAELVAKVYTIEIVEPLGRRAMQVLDELGYRNVEVRIGDGYNGWPEAAPFDSIVVTAPPTDIPTPLISQLKRGGRMMIPSGASDMQYLLLVEKRPDGTTTTRRTLPVRFVPFTRDRAK